ncbi:4Fe-4S single cluster domain-containing protein [Candidatus Hakubella thermalkaliphila]|nr:4Fe-4S single cluster domain-containing protein [Candidatus Hakubella thermalkaliphila]
MGAWLFRCKRGMKMQKKTVEDIFYAIRKASLGLDGITISGGEPFEQAEALLRLVRLIKEHTSLDIMVYSGYTIEDLNEQGESASKLLSLIDILIDGRFEEENSNKKLWRGSDNQRFHILSERAKKYARYAEEEYRGQRELHFEMSEGNSFKIIGIPNRGFMRDLKKQCRGLGLTLTQP